MANLTNAFDTSEWSDLIVRCQESEFKVHKVVVCNQSRFFKNACCGNFVEAATNAIDLHDDDVELVELMLRFMYHQDYTQIQESDYFQTPDGPLTDVRMYAIADKYMVDTLKEAVADNIRTITQYFPINSDFIRAIKEAYKVTTPNNNLREAFIDLCADNTKAFGQDSGLETEFSGLLDEEPVFAADLAQKLVDRLNNSKVPGERTFQCPSCQKRWKAVYGSPTRQCHCAHCGHLIRKEHMHRIEVHVP